MSRYTPEVIQAVREARKSGMSYKKIALKFGLKTTIEAWDIANPKEFQPKKVKEEPANLSGIE